MGNPKALAYNEPRHVGFVVDNGGRYPVQYNMDITFEYVDNYPVRLNNTVEERHVTLAFLRDNYPNGKSTVFTGMAVLKPGEQLDRPYGREVALSKIIHNQLVMSPEIEARFWAEFYAAEQLV